MSLRPKSEAALLSAMVNTGAINKVLTLGLTPDMFIACGAEFRWCLDYERAHGKAPTPEALMQKFPGFRYAEDRTDVPFYVGEVIHDHNRRNLVKTIRDAATYVAEGDLDEAVLTMGAYTQQALVKPLENALHNEVFLDHYDDPVDALRWPWATLQDVTGGHRRGELYYIGARLGQGKSWTMASMVGNALMHNRKVMFYSLEMSEEQILTRMHVYLGAQLGHDVDHIAMRNKIYDINGYRKLVRAIKDEIGGELYIRDTSRGVISPLTVQTAPDDADLIVIDHVGLMHQPTGGRAVDDWRAMAVISNSLKEIALGKNARILAAAQINREGDNGGRKPPKVKNLAQSDALGQDADCVITHKRWGRSTMCYSIEKTRDGYSEVPFYTTFEPNHGKFREISRDEAEDRLEAEEDE